MYKKVKEEGQCERKEQKLVNTHEHQVWDESNVEKKGSAINRTLENPDSKSWINHGKGRY